MECCSVSVVLNGLLHLYLMCCVAPFTSEERSLLGELRYENVGSDRVSEILEKTWDSRKKWVVHGKPTYTEFIQKFPSFQDLGPHVSFVNRHLVSRQHSGLETSSF